MTSDPDFLRRPLANTRRASGGLQREQSEALLDAAGNLLTKATDRLAKNQDEVAGKLIDRAVALPYDDYEEVHPALYWLELKLYSQLDEQAEDAGKDDVRWIDRAEELMDEVAAAATGMVRAALQAVAQETPLPHAQERRLHRLIGASPELQNVTFGRRSTGELTATVLGTLQASISMSRLYRRDLQASIAAQEAEIQALTAEVAHLKTDQRP